MQWVQTLKCTSLHVEWNTNKQAFHSRAITSATPLTDSRISTTVWISSSRTTTRRSRRQLRNVCSTYGKQLHICSSITSSVKGCEIQSSKMSPGTWLAVAGDQAESAQGFCQTEGKFFFSTVRKCFHLEEHLVSPS